MTTRRLIASYFISLAALWLITSIAAGVWRGSVLGGVEVATAAPFVPLIYGVGVLVTDWSPGTKQFALAVACVVLFLVLIGSVITAFRNRTRKRWLVVSHLLGVVYWVTSLWMISLLARIWLG